MAGLPLAEPLDSKRGSVAAEFNSHAAALTGSRGLITSAKATETILIQALKRRAKNHPLCHVSNILTISFQDKIALFKPSAMRSPIADVGNKVRTIGIYL